MLYITKLKPHKITYQADTDFYHITTKLRVISKEQTIHFGRKFTCTFEPDAEMLAMIVDVEHENLDQQLKAYLKHHPNTKIYAIQRS